MPQAYSINLYELCQTARHLRIAIPGSIVNPFSNLRYWSGVIRRTSSSDIGHWN